MSITADIVGGLGNQLFTIATMLNISKTQNKPYFLKKVNTSSVTPRETFWDTLLHKLSYTDNIPNTNLFIQERDSNNVIKIPNINENHAKIQGYFQSSKYFDRSVLEHFQLPENDQKIVDDIWRKIKESYPGKKINFLHVRRGDYLNLQHFHIVLPIEWYKRCLKHFDDDDVFLIFSDDQHWCKENFGFIKNKEFISDKDYREIFIMAKCDGAIVANSSFSWWGAYMMGEDKKVVCPDIWFRDMFPQKYMRNEAHWLEEEVIL